MLATIRPDSWNLPLFLHVLGAMTLFGATLTGATLAWVAPRQPAVLARATFRTLLVAALPAWVLMRLAGGWIESKEDFGDNEPGWLGVGFIVAEPGLLLLLVAIGLAFWSTRRGGAGWQPRAVAVLATVYVAALAVAWWAMSAKP